MTGLLGLSIAKNMAEKYEKTRFTAMDYTNQIVEKGTAVGNH
jgi:hypothetical protein